MKLTTDGKYSVFIGKREVARSYVGNDGYEVRVLQGMDRMELVDRIFNEVPEFAQSNNMNRNVVPKLFAR